MANCFFVDFENVHNSGFSNLKGLSKDDLFFIFYTANSESITLDNVERRLKDLRSASKDDPKMFLNI